LSYTYVYTQKSLAVPAALDALGVETWNVSVSSKTASSGTPEYTIAGSCKLRGAGAVEVPLNTELSGRNIYSPEGMTYPSTEDALLGGVGAMLYGNMEQLVYFIENELLGDAVAITNREIKTNPASRTVSFSFTCNLPGGSGGGGGGVVGVEFSYSWNHSGGGYSVNEVKRLGRLPYFQMLSENAFKLTENCTLQSRSSYPQEPVPFFGNNLILLNNNVDRTPDYDKVGNAVYQTQFRYTYQYLGGGAMPDFGGRAASLFAQYGKINRGRYEPIPPRKEELSRRTIGF
jgi:hypothetical protein